MRKLTALIIIIFIICIPFSSFVSAADGDAKNIEIDWENEGLNEIKEKIAQNPAQVLQDYPEQAREFMRKPSNQDWVAANKAIADTYLSSVQGPISDPADKEILRKYLSSVYDLPLFEHNGEVTIQGDTLTQNGQPYSLSALKRLGPIKVISPADTPELILILDQKGAGKLTVNLETNDFEVDDNGNFVMGGETYDLSATPDTTIRVRNLLGSAVFNCDKECNIQVGSLNVHMRTGGGTFSVDKNGNARAVNSEVIQPGSKERSMTKLIGESEFVIKNGKIDTTQPIISVGGGSYACRNEFGKSTGRCAYVPPVEGSPGAGRVALCLDCSKSTRDKLDKAVQTGGDYNHQPLTGYVAWYTDTDSKNLDRPAAIARGDFLANFNHQAVIGMNKDVQWTFKDDSVLGNRIFNTDPGKHDSKNPRIGVVFTNSGVLEYTTELYEITEGPKDGQTVYGGVHVSKTRIEQGATGGVFDDVVRAGEQYALNLAGGGTVENPIYYRSNSAMYVDLLMNPDNYDFDKNKAGIQEPDPAQLYQLIQPSPVLADGDNFADILPNFNNYLTNKVLANAKNGKYGEEFKTLELTPFPGSDVKNFYCPDCEDTGAPAMAIAVEKTFGTLKCVPTSGAGMDCDSDNDLVSIYNNLGYGENSETTWLSHDTIKMDNQGNTEHVENVYVTKGNMLMIDQRNIEREQYFRTYLNTEYKIESYTLANKIKPPLTQKEKDEYVSRRMSQLETSLYLDNRRKQLLNLVEYVDEANWDYIKDYREFAFLDKDTAITAVRKLNTQAKQVESIQGRLDKGETLIQIHDSADADILQLFAEEPSMNMRLMTEVIDTGHGLIYLGDQQFDLSDPKQRDQASVLNLLMTADRYAKGDPDANLGPDPRYAMEMYTGMAAGYFDSAHSADFEKLMAAVESSGAYTKGGQAQGMIATTGYGPPSPATVNVVTIDGQEYQLSSELAAMINSGAINKELAYRMVATNTQITNQEQWDDFKEFTGELLPDSMLDIALNVVPELTGFAAAGFLVAEGAGALARGAIRVGLKDIALGTLKTGVIGAFGVSFGGGAAREGAEDLSKAFLKDTLDDSLRLGFEGMDDLSVMRFTLKAGDDVPILHYRIEDIPKIGLGPGEVNIDEYMEFWLNQVDDETRAFILSQEKGFVAGTDIITDSTKNIQDELYKSGVIDDEGFFLDDAGNRIKDSYGNEMKFMSGRVKDPHKVEEKVYRKYEELVAAGEIEPGEASLAKVRKEIFEAGPQDELAMTDIAGLRITVSSLEQEAEAARLIEEQFGKDAIIKKKDYISDPLGDGNYRSIHYVVDVDDVPVEIQIRTPRQTAWADWSHDTLYKGAWKNDEEALEYSKEVSDYFYDLDNGAKQASNCPMTCPDMPPCPTRIASAGLCFDTPVRVGHS